MLTLGQKQRLFTRMVSQLIRWAYDNGYELTLGEAKRTDEQAEINALGEDGRARLVRHIQSQFPLLAEKIGNNTGSGIRNSLHEVSLAIDLNLFRNEVYLSRTEDHRRMGEFWESIGGTWGGRFGDGNHYSLGHNGKR